MIDNPVGNVSKPRVKFGVILAFQAPKMDREEY